MAELGPETMSVDAIRRRIEHGYVFDQPGEVIVTQDADLRWALKRIRVLEQAIEAHAGPPSFCPICAELVTSMREDNA